MSDERIIGELQEHKRSADRRFDSIERSLRENYQETQKQLEALMSFRWKMIGACSLISIIFSLAAEYVIFK